MIEELLKNLYSALIKHKKYFYKTQHQAEIDLILEGRFGLMPIEIKSGKFKSKDQIHNLKNFIKEQNCKFGILINNGSEIVR